MTRSPRYLLLALLLGACALPFPDVSPDAQLSCDDDAQCPDGQRCHPVLEICFSTVPECANNTDLLPDGTICDRGDGDGVCVAGACVASECGDGFLDLALNVEACDDGNEVDTDACTNVCALAACGDGIVHDGVEACDDGNTVSGDGCRGDCGKVEICGDGTIDAGEDCDDGNNVNTDFCAGCVVNVCGDGIQNPATEACDDGNTLSGDGCRSDCGKIEICGDGFVDDGEACDDGNANPSDACDACAVVDWIPTVLTGFGPGGGVGANTVFESPSFVVSDVAGNAYVFGSQLRDCRVRRIDPTGAVSVVAGNGECEESGDGGPATGAGLAAVEGLFVDARGRVFIAGRVRCGQPACGGVIRRVNERGIIERVAGTGFLEAADGEGELAIDTALDPHGLVVAGDGTIFFVDRQLGSNPRRVRKVDLDGRVRTVAGGGAGVSSSPDGAPALGATIDIDENNHLALSLRPDGALCFAETDAVRCVESDGTLSTILGTSGRDVASFSVHSTDIDGWVCPRSFLGTGDGCDCGCGVVDPDCVDASFGSCEFNGNCPAVDPGDPTQCTDGPPPSSDETLFIERGDHRVQLVDRAGAFFRLAGVDTAAPGCAQPFSGDGGLATDATLACPRDFALTPAGDLYIADSNHDRIRRVRGGIIETVLGTGASRDDVVGVRATAIPHEDNGQVALDPSGRPVLVDAVTHRITRYNDDGSLTVLAGRSGFGVAAAGDLATEAFLGFPHDVVFDSSGRMLIAETQNGRVLRVELDGTLAIIAGDNGFADFGDGGAATAAAIRSPTGLALAPDGSLFISDQLSNKVRRVDAAGIITTFAGTGVAGFAGDGGAATSAQLNSPRDITFHEGELYIADHFNDRIRVVSAAGTIRSLPLDFAGRPEGLFFDGDDLYIAAAQTDNPTAGSVFRLDDQGNLFRFAGTGDGFTDSGDGSSAIAANLEQPVGVAVDSDGRVLIATAERLRRVDVAGNITSLVGGIDPPVGTLAVTRLLDPTSVVAVDADRLFVTSELGGRLLSLRPSLDATEVVVGYPDGFPLGLDPAGANRARLVELLDGAAGVAWDGASVLYLTERGAARVWAVDVPDLDDPSGWTASLFSDDDALSDPAALLYDPIDDALIFAEPGAHVVRSLDIGTGALTTRAGVPFAAGVFGEFLNAPSAIALGLDGALFVADTGNHRVLRFDDDGAALVIGTGEPASSGTGAPATNFPVESPAGLAVDGFGNLLVSSTRAVRLVAADDSGVVRGDAAVHTLYGAAPRDTFPENATFCLAGLTERDDGRVLVTDRCAGYLVEIRRITLP